MHCWPDLWMVRPLQLLNQAATPPPLAAVAALAVFAGTEECLFPCTLPKSNNISHGNNLKHGPIMHFSHPSSAYMNRPHGTTTMDMISPFAGPSSLLPILTVTPRHAYREILRLHLRHRPLPRHRLCPRQPTMYILQGSTAARRSP